jgi:hypothetical protein
VSIEGSFVVISLDGSFNNAVALEGSFVAIALKGSFSYAVTLAGAWETDLSLKGAT